MLEVIVKFLVELLILENLHFASNFTKLSAIEQTLWLSIGFDWSLGSCIGSHLGGHLGFAHLDMTEVILMYQDELLILENLYFATIYNKLSDVE